MITIDSIQNQKPKLVEIKDTLEQANTLIDCYKYFYIQCCDNDKLNYTTEPYEFVVWNYGFIIDDDSATSENMIVYKKSDIVNFTDQQIQDFIDTVEKNAILNIKKREEQNKLNRIKQDFN